MTRSSGSPERWTDAQALAIKGYPDEAAGKGTVYTPDSAIAKQTARNRRALLYLIDAAACPYAVIGKAAQYCSQASQADPSARPLDR